MTSGQDRVALVTGGSRGIGAAIARKLSADGYRVAVVGRDRGRLEELARETSVLPIVADLSRPGAAESVLAGVRSVLGDVDVLVPNAGMEGSYKLDETTDAIWDELFAINVTSAFRFCRAAMPGMAKRGFGRVVVIASDAGLIGYSYSTAYCASKHAVVGMVRGLAAEYARTNVTINAVCPGFVDTSMATRSIEKIAAKTGRGTEESRQALAAMSPQRRLFDPREVAHLVSSLLPDDARGIHGQALALDGGRYGG